MTKPFNTSFARRAAVLQASLAVAFILCIHAAGRLGAFCSPLRNDSYLYAAFGYRMTHGDVLYRDMSDIKPPGLFLIYAMNYLVLPPGRAALIPVESLALLLGYLAVYKSIRVPYGANIALCVSILAAVAVNYFSIMGYVIEGFGLAESFMILPAVAAFSFYLNGKSTGRRTPLLLTGVFLALDASIKQSAIAVIAAIAIHHAAGTLGIDREPRRWLRQSALIAAGASLAALPFVAALLAQGTLHTAVELLTRHAAPMIARGTAWPAAAADIKPLWLPFAWCAWWLLSAFPRPSPRAASLERDAQTSHAPTVGLLLLWCLCESLLVALLPLRSAHYYIAACLPFVLLTAPAIHGFRRRLQSLTRPAQRAASTVALLASFSLLRPVINECVPVVLSRWKSYDPVADRRRFDDLVNSGPIHFGRGAPFLDSAPVPSPRGPIYDRAPSSLPGRDKNPMLD